MKKNWVYYMQEGLRNMFRKKPKRKIPENWIHGMSMELKEKELYKDECKCKDCGCK